MVEDAKDMNTQARVCAYQLHLHLFPGFEALPRYIHGNGIEQGPYTQAILVPSVLKPPTA